MKSESHSRLDKIFEPKSVCFVGASNDEHKLTGRPLAFLRRHAYPGDIHVIHPAKHPIQGIAPIGDYEQLPRDVDLAFISLQALKVPQAIDRLAGRGVRQGIVISSGFEEQPGQDKVVAALRESCSRNDFLLIGPNCEGIWSVRAKAILSFGSAAKRDSIMHGPVAIISQSGAIGGALSRHLQERGIGCSYFVSVGNETVVSCLDTIEYLTTKDDAKIVLLFVEGIRDGDKLARLGPLLAERGVTVIALKSGNSEIGRRAAATHSGKMASESAIYGDVFEQHGFIQVESISQMVDAAETIRFSRAPIMTTSAGLAVCSFPGGTRALTSDLCERHDVPLATFEPETESSLQAFLPEFASSHNPTDLTGQILSQPDLFGRALRTICADPNTGSLIIQFANGGLTDIDRLSSELQAIDKARTMPVFTSLLGDRPAEDKVLRLRAEGVIVTPEPNEAVLRLSWLYKAARNAGAGRDAAQASSTVTAPPTAGIGSWNDFASFIARTGISTPRTVAISSEAEARSALTGIAYPVALKVLPERLAHKTEAGGLVLGLQTAQDVLAARADLRARLGALADTLLLQEMVSGGTELSLTFLRDPDFGPLIAFGCGGILIEVLKDQVYLQPPFSQADMVKAIGRLQGAKLIGGYRGRPGIATDRLAAMLKRFADAALTLPANVLALEINPLIISPRDGGAAYAVDYLVETSPLD